MTDTRFTAEEIEAVRDAILALDALWELDEARGMRDGRGGAEYARLSPVPTLRHMIGEAE